MDEKDIAPELLERIRADFLALLGDAQQEADTYTAAAAYAELVGSALADAFRRNLTADILPDGRLYWNIADRVVRPLLEEDYARIADAAAAAVSGVALWPGHTTTPMFRKMFTAATSAAAAGWNMTPARDDGRTCGIKRGQRSRKSFSPVRSLQKHHSLTKSIFPAIFLCRAFSRNICGRLHRVLVLSHMIQAMTWCAMQMK